MRRRSLTGSSWRRTGQITLALLLGTTGGALIIARVYGLGVPATVVAVLIGVPPLWLAWVPYRDDRRNLPDMSLEHLADQLAVAVGAQWEAEAQIRRLNDPYPLPVSWSAADPLLADDWEVLERLARTGVGWPDPPRPGRWAVAPVDLGGADGGLADALMRIPTRRLVVLGEPGSGKTMLMLRLVLDLLKDRSKGGPVPFLVSLASWNPEEQALVRWLADQLVIGRPLMAALVQPGAINAAESLLRAGLIMPVLDGLDEIPDAIRGPAIGRINDALRAGGVTVLTCRTEDYRRAVTPSEGPQVRLRGAAVVELDPLTPETIAEYLLADAGGAAAKSRWAPILGILGSAIPVAQALTTPLMAGLARVIYNPRPDEVTGKSRNPAELLAPELADREAVEAHLFEAFIPAAYRGECRWTAQQAEPWLKFLAHYLEAKIRGQDIAWWQLPLVLGGPAFLRNRNPKPPPIPSRKVVFQRSRFMQGAKTGLAIGLAVGGLSLLAETTNWDGLGTGGLAVEILVAVFVGVFFGVIIGAVIGVTFGLGGVPDDRSYVASPDAILTRDRRATLIVALPAIPAGILTGLAASAYGLPLSIFFGLLIGVFVASIAGLDLAWLQFVITRVFLARRHQLPWRLMAFLADAHQRGVLRQEGAVYQFRHIELQRQLALGWVERRKRWWQSSLDFSAADSALAQLGGHAPDRQRGLG